jgi:dolichol-phosphate mannosyltransferase
MSRAASACAWPLTDVHDALSGFFAVRRELLAGIPSDAAGFKVALEVLVRGGDAIRVGEVPIAFRDRELGQSKMGTGVILTYFRRLLALSGWRESQDSVATAIAKTALVWIVDFAIFALSLHMRSSLSGANLLGFAAGALLNGWLKRAQLPAESRTGPVLGARLVFVSLLALFLRGGVLGTCVRALRWAPQAAILPAIVTGWVVLYLGYALFIWPVREQYGRGVRWRVAAMGAAAYLVALRVVYMYTMPTDARLAAIPWKADGLTLPERVTAWLRHGGTMAFGGGRAGLNGPALLCWGVGAWAVFKLTQRVMDKTTAFRALLLFSVLPVFFWMGAVFSPDSLLVAGWAVALWLGVFANRRKLGRAQGIAFIVVEAIFWGLWAQPGVVVESGLSWVARAPLFFVWQAVLVTPLVLIEVARAFTKMRAVLFKGAPASGAECDREITVAAAGAVGLVLAAVIGILVFVGYMENRLGLMASGAIWLPLLPWIAADMQKPGRWWGAVIYGCVVLYGGYLYWLAFPRWR